MVPFAMVDVDAVTLMDCSEADAVKFMPLFDPPLRATDWLGGMKFSPVLLGMMT